jgi:hypothetical protein
VKLKLILTALIVVSACFYGFREALLYKIGAFLVVDQPIDKVDVAVTSALKEKVVQCYHDGNCKKIMLVVANYGSTWKGNRNPDIEKDIYGQAQQFGIQPADLIVFDRPQDDIQFFISMEKLLLEKNLHSALYYVGYYKSRRYRFYLDRYFHDKEIATYVQPTNTDKDYMRNLERWWENTLLDNLFIDEYLRIGFYYFNKMFWFSFV